MMTATVVLVLSAEAGTNLAVLWDFPVQRAPDL